MNWKSKLTSRKFWAAVASFVAMLVVAFGGAQEQATQITALIMAGATVIAYVVGEGLVDAASAGAQATTPNSAPVIDTVDTSAAEGTPTGAAQAAGVKQDTALSGQSALTAEDIAKAFVNALQAVQTAQPAPSESGAVAPDTTGAV